MDKIPLPVYLHIKTLNNDLALELRKIITDRAIIKDIVTCGLNDTPIVIQPFFSDKLKGISSMIEKGLLHKEGEEYVFTEIENK